MKKNVQVYMKNNIVRFILSYTMQLNKTQKEALEFDFGPP
jgi:hypothetical protein